MNKLNLEKLEYQTPILILIFSKLKNVKWWKNRKIDSSQSRLNQIKIKLIKSSENLMILCCFKSQ
jgi:glucose-6-phosphate dehydrogenase assembly protein OpcA